MNVSAPRDQNRIPALIAVSSSDGLTIDKIKVNSTSHGIKISDGTTGIDHGTPNAQRDPNHVPCVMGVSSVDGVTPVAIYSDGNGNLLTQST